MKKLSSPDNHGMTIYSVIGFAVLALLAPIVAQTFGGNYWVRVLDFALLYIMLALGLNIVVGFAGLLDLGYIAFFAVGAYMMALLSSPHLTSQFEWLAHLFPNGIHLGFWWVVLLAGPVAALAGALLGAPTLKLRGDYLAIVTLIGANGAGKTTTMKAITGLQGWVSGEAEYLGKSIKGVPSHTLLRQGLAMVPEGRGVFARMTIVENLQMGAYSRNDAPGIAADVERMFVIFPRLKERATQLAGTMSGGEQQMLAMARALMSKPRLLLLDEPSMGLSPIMVEKVFQVVRDISAQGVTVLLVEQNARLALMAADRGYVMESGLITMSGNAKDMLDDPKVRAAYLGE